MSGYYFNIQNGHSYCDDVGEELPDDRAAWASAVRLAREIENVMKPGGSWHLEVRTQ